MDENQGVPAEFLEPLRRAQAGLTVADEVGLALRAHRRELGMSQREYAAARGLSRPKLARLEADAGRMHLESIQNALEGTGFALSVSRCPSDPRPEGDEEGSRVGSPAQLVVVGASVRRSVLPEEWESTDLVARVRGGRRRFPAHRAVQAVDSPPLWWWMHEFFEGPSEEPRWYSPVPLRSLADEDADLVGRSPTASDGPTSATDDLAGDADEAGAA